MRRGRITILFWTFGIRLRPLFFRSAAPRPGRTNLLIT